MSDTSNITTAPAPQSRSTDAFAIVLLVMLSLAIGLYRIAETGPMWPDDPRYANAGAMVHDWLRSDQWLHPYAFAQRNYTQYPGFSVPYHPPGYPGLLGLFMLFTGVGHVPARVFVSLCAAAAAVAFYGIVRRQGLSCVAALVTSALLATTPEIIRWQRSTMSEVPALAMLLGATYLFWRWYDTDRSRYVWAAAGMALLAMLCRVTSVGVVPSWWLFIALSSQPHRARSPQLLAAGACFAIGSAAFILVAARFGSNEVWADGRNHGLALRNVLFWPGYFFHAGRWGTSWAAIAGFVIAARNRPWQPITKFWLCWLVSFAAFKLLVPTAFELRHGFYVIPALAGLAGQCAASAATSPALRLLLGAALVVNVSYLARVPLGITGFDQVAETLAEQTESGNVLISCWHDSELMFRYRAVRPDSTRRMLRGDRTLSIRVPGYAKQSTERRARDTSDVLQLMRDGRARYLVTCDIAENSALIRPAEMKLAHRTATSHPDSFRLLGRCPIVVHYQAERNDGWVYLWEYLGGLPSGPSQLPIEIPTAGLKL